MNQSEVTVMCKTALRPEPLKDFLQSVRKHYDKMPIRIVDDSPQPYPGVSLSKVYEPIKHETFDDDIGIGICLNHVLDTCDTEFILLCEDDFTFTAQTRLEGLLAWVKSDVYDIMGGGCRAVATGARQSYMGHFVFPDDGGPPDPKPVSADKIKTVTSFDITLNFFLARTDVLKELRWDETLKVARHVDFFLRAGGWRHHKCPERVAKVLKVGYCPAVVIDHNSVQSPLEYRERRFTRLPEFQKEYCRLWGFNHNGKVVT